MDARGAVGAEFHPGDVEWDGREVFPHRNVFHALLAAGAAARSLTQRDYAERHVAGVPGGHAGRALDDEGGKRIERLFFGQREHGLIDHPDGGLAREGAAGVVGQMEDEIDLLRGAGVGGRLEPHLHLIIDRRDGEPGGRGDRYGLAEVEGGGGGGRGAGKAAPHQEQVHREPGHLRFADGDLDAAVAVGDAQPGIREGAFGLFDDHQAAGGLEWALHDDGGGLPGGVGGFVR